MKRIFCLMMLLTLFQIGCKKNPLDISPSGRITMKEVFEDAQKTEAYLNTVYSYIPEHFYSYGYFGWLAGVEDDAMDAYRANSLTWNNGGLTVSSNPLNGYYSNYWKGIRDANVFLTNIDNANVPNEKNRSRFKAEAQILRAFYYFEMIKQYGPMPIVEEPLDPSFDFKSLKRPTFQENVDFIIRNCDAALSSPDLPMRIVVPAEFGRFTKAVAHMIKSEALLFNASPLWNPDGNYDKWQAAATASKQALNALTADGTYQLISMSNYEEYFQLSTDVGTTPRDKETILQGYDTHNRTNFVNFFSIPSKTGAAQSGLNPTQELVDSYDMQATGEPPILGYSDERHLNPIINTASGYNPQDPYVGRDPRFYATVWYNGALYDNIGGAIHTMQIYIGGSDQPTTNESNALNTHTGYYMRKFVDPKLQTSQPTAAMPKLLRLAEIYLNLAEAENEANGPSQIARDAINAIRNRANMPDLPLSLTKEEFRERVRKERRVEFPFEEKRFWDVRRWKILDDTHKLVTGMMITKDGNDFRYTRTVTQTMNAWQDKYLIYPIPLHDVSNVPDFSENQNPGW